MYAMQDGIIISHPCTATHNHVTKLNKYNYSTTFGEGGGGGGGGGGKTPNTTQKNRRYS